ncbi:Uncharacterised protein [Mycobacteroides abscessus subsp. abscessus]|nr:Uncharacterised protein [Mycobacteroides abscessus subsp. abscessus]
MPTPGSTNTRMKIRSPSWARTFLDSMLRSVFLQVLMASTVPTSCKTSVGST